MNAELLSLRAQAAYGTGDLEGTLDAYGELYHLRLELAQGRVGEVLSMINSSLNHPFDIPSKERPPSGGLQQAPLRDAHSGLGKPGLEVFDSKAREAYRQRLTETEEDIEEARENNDFHRAELARADRQFLIDELRRDVGLNDRARTVGDGLERARTSATRSLRYALKRIRQHHPSLGEHLERTIRTGSYFAYEPDPRAGTLEDLTMPTPRTTKLQAMVSELGSVPDSHRPSLCVGVQSLPRNCVIKYNGLT